VGRVVRANTPEHLSPGELAAATAYGLSAVLDLRSEDERLRSAHPLERLPGYQWLPLIDPAAEAREDFSQFTTLGDIYSTSLQRNAKHLARIFAALATSRGAVLISCRAGRDRTGMVIALLLDLAGVDRGVIRDDYLLLPDAAGRPAGDHRGQCSNGSDIEAMLEHVTAVYGSAGAYMRCLGLDARSVDALEARLLPF